MSEEKIFKLRNKFYRELEEVHAGVQHLFAMLRMKTTMPDVEFVGVISDPGVPDDLIVETLAHGKWHITADGDWLGGEGHKVV